MIYTKSESDITSLAPSSPSRSPKRQLYYVQSPSMNSQDGDKATSMQAITPNYNSPMESPSHHSFGRHSRNSSASLFSGFFRSSSGRKMNSGRKRFNDKGWPECNVIMEEGKYDEFEKDKAFTRRCQAIMAFFSFLILFTVFCLIIWGASRPYKPQVSIKSLVVNNIYMGQGSDSTGVLTKMITMNGTLKISVYNAATFFGVHVSSSPVKLLYSDITVASGQVKKYFQPRKSMRIVMINIEGTKVPLYGAGSSLPASTNNGIQVGLMLEFEIRTRGNVVGKLVTTNHKRKVSCPVDIDSTTNKPIEFDIKNNNTCSYT
ncbi:uncharacterized protein LOC124915158 [Impatiens glandulifera]|uniref:uncharacterized protein LOC124915158 n=1 Tax=Impatiens glandulifera TaxID=253017 RepID=UPI001FB099B1|nr:uncharacterized protein LOC124915158 [Impatiens glandulifera]